MRKVERGLGKYKIEKVLGTLSVMCGIGITEVGMKKWEKVKVKNAITITYNKSQVIRIYNYLPK